VPGIGTILSRVWRDELHPIDRFPRVQDFASDGRLVTWANDAGGKRVGTSGNKRGNAHLKWAFSEAATRFLRGHEPGQTSLAKFANKPDKGQALRIRAHTRARAVSVMLTRQTALDLEQCLRTAGSRTGAPGADLDTEGMSRHRRTDVKPRRAASWSAEGRLGPISLRPALCLDTRSGAGIGGV
jgi:hypothetical protein